MKQVKEGKFYKWEVLILLWMGYLLNQADRQVFNTVLPAIRDALDLTDTSVGHCSILHLPYLFQSEDGWVTASRASGL